ncbi:hypothetical protein BDZ89DRAFT_1037127 [Hymenopellis radicata]|nr:hypothetical protein BDZ89DRAFT_1037127 [Hymenopellis radicata]
MARAGTSKKIARKQSTRKKTSVGPKKRGVGRTSLLHFAIAILFLLMRNTKGFPILPMELHLEILSHLPSIPVPCMLFGILPHEYRLKFDVMFASSQTCRALYHLLKPVLWETLDVCTLGKESPTIATNPDSSKAMATELVRILEVVTIREPELGSVLNVALTTFSAVNVYKELARCLQLLPNLRTLQIISFPAGRENDKYVARMLDAFRYTILPTIDTLTLLAYLYDIIVALCGQTIFPNILHLNITEISHTCSLIDRSCSQEIHTLQLSAIIELQKADIFSVVDRFPHLRVTPRLRRHFYRDYPESEEEVTNKCISDNNEAFRALRRLTRLHTIQVDISFVKMGSWRVDPVTDNICTLARTLILRNLHRPENAAVAEGMLNLTVDCQEISIRITREITE